MQCFLCHLLFFFSHTCGNVPCSSLKCNGPSPHDLRYWHSDLLSYKPTNNQRRKNSSTNTSLGYQKHKSTNPKADTRFIFREWEFLQETQKILWEKHRFFFRKNGLWRAWCGLLSLGLLKQGTERVIMEVQQTCQKVANIASKKPMARSLEEQNLCRSSCCFYSSAVRAGGTPAMWWGGGGDEGHRSLNFFDEPPVAYIQTVTTRERERAWRESARERELERERERGVWEGV